MENFCRIVINLSSNINGGRYNVSYKEFPIHSVTPKTISVNTGNTIQRYLTGDLMIAKSDFINDKLSRIQFYTICYKKDLKKAVEILERTLYDKIQALKKENQLAEEAFLKGCKLIKS
jgi:hypothetical protein